MYFHDIDMDNVTDMETELNMNMHMPMDTDIHNDKDTDKEMEMNMDMDKDVDMDINTDTVCWLGSWTSDVFDKIMLELSYYQNIDIGPGNLGKQYNIGLWLSKSGKDWAR